MAATKYVMAKPTGIDGQWEIEGGIFTDGDIIAPMDKTNSQWARYWTYPHNWGILCVDPTTFVVKVADPNYLCSKSELIDRNIGRKMTGSQYRELLKQWRAKKVKPTATFEYGGAVGTVEARCQYTGEGLRCGQGELTIHQVKRELGEPAVENITKINEVVLNK